MTCIGIIGCGSVGASIAFTLTLSNICSTLLLYDVNKMKAVGEAADLEDTNKAKVHVVDTLEEMQIADVIIITAGVKRTHLKSRLDMLAENKAIFDDIANRLYSVSPSCIFIVVSNPVDIMTRILQKALERRIHQNQIIGTGTLLDSHRLRLILAEKLDMSPQSIDAFVMGEHGDSQFVPWSLCRIGGVPLTKSFNNSEQQQRIEEEVRKRAYKIITHKGATYYGIATVVAHLCSAVLCNEKAVLPVSTYHEDHDVCLSTMSIIGKQGVLKQMNIELNEIEKSKFLNSVTTLQTAMRDI